MAKVIDPATSLRIPFAHQYHFERDEGDLVIVQLELSEAFVSWAGNCPFQQGRIRHKFRGWNCLYRVFENY